MTFICLIKFAICNTCLLVIDEGEILYRHYIDISVAVATPKGLVVPVLRNVETMDYAAIEKMLNEYAIKVPA